MGISNALVRGWQRVPLLIADIFLIPLLLWAAFALRFGTIPPNIGVDRMWLLLLSIVVSVVPFIHLGLYRAVIRYIGQEAAVLIIQGATVSALLLFGAGWLLQLNADPAVFIIFWAIALIYVGGSRFAIRAYYRRKKVAKASPVGIYGAGDAGRQLAAAINSGSQCHVKAFFDDDTFLEGAVIDGTPVFGTYDVQRVVRNRKLKEIFLALPSASRQQRQQVLRRLEFLPVPIRTVPHLEELVIGLAQVDDLRDIDLVDLLERAPVAAKPALLSGSVKGRNVMITGAGGSIGSELCRQIIRLNPRSIILYEISEYGMYAIEKELSEIVKSSRSHVEIHPILGSVRERRHIERVMSHYKVNVVFHAAAYKHVPMLEKNILEGVLNNVIGTWNAAEAALTTGASKFVLVSTDKAVRPTNLMGATKRVAEQIVQSIQERETKRGPQTAFCSVRFGNVLGSSGSVVPHFKQQILKGGPVTVTHPEVTRYFMTISEAAQLVIQASAMAQGGEVFLLDMGEPVKILELAKRMIHLMGFTEKTGENQEGNIRIDFIGLRAGEKLFEETLISGNVFETEHQKIVRADESFIAWDRLRERLNQLSSLAMQDRCDDIVDKLTEIVPEYVPSERLRGNLESASNNPLPRNTSVSEV